MLLLLLCGSFYLLIQHALLEAHQERHALQVEEEPKVTVRDLDIAAAEEDTDEARILCARCYSLSHYG